MLQNPTVPGADPDFLAGGGEMGERMRALDWWKTPLGPAECWPQSLKTIVRVMLDSRYAMWMLWGPELQDGDRQRALAAGFDRHLTKPVDPDALLALI